MPGNLFGVFDAGTDAKLGSELIIDVIDGGGGLALTDRTAPHRTGTQVLVPYVSRGFTVGDSMASLRTSVVFNATSCPNGRDTLAYNELWVTDGTAAGTSRIVTLPDNTSVGGLKEARI